MDSLNLTVQPRTIVGKKVKSLRQDGITPINMFGRGVESQALQVESALLLSILRQAGTNVPVVVAVDGHDGEHVCFIRVVQRDPVNESMLHVDLQRVDVSQRVTAEVPISIEGESPAVLHMSGTLIQPLTTVSVEALPMSMPTGFTIDISILDTFDKTIRVDSIETDEDVSILNDISEMIATVVPPRVEEEEVEEEEDLEGIEGEEGEEGEEVEEGESQEQEG